MGFLIESCLDENGVITMYACFVTRVLDDVNPWRYRTDRQQITDETIGVVSNDERLFSWTKNDFIEDSFKLHYQSHQLRTIYDTNHTVLQEMDKRLYCVDNSKLHNIEL